MWTAVGYWNPFLRLTFKFFRHIYYLSSCKAPFTCSKGSNISGLSKPLASCLFLFFQTFFFSLLLFVRFQHMLTMLYDLGLGSLPTGHDDIPDNTGATGASRSLPANPPNGMCVLKIWHASQGLRCSRGTEGLCLDRFLTRLRQNNRPLNSFFSGEILHWPSVLLRQQWSVRRLGRRNYTTGSQYDAKTDVVFLQCSFDLREWMVFMRQC